jgi:hypothetical protein
VQYRDPPDTRREGGSGKREEGLREGM